MVSVLTSAEGANQALLPTALETAMSPKKYTDVGEGVCITGTAVATVPPVPVVVYHPSGSLGQLSGFYAIGTAGEILHVGIIDR